MFDYPCMMYREGFGLDWEGKSFETTVVEDAYARAEALAAGFVTAAELHTLYQPPKPETTAKSAVKLSAAGNPDG